MDELLSAVFLFVIEVVVINTGRAVLAVVTLGKWRGEKLASREARVYGLAGALSFKREGQRIVTANGLLFIGGAFYVGVVAWLAYLAST
jgi:hypothetical protein